LAINCLWVSDIAFSIQILRNLQEVLGSVGL